MTSPRPKTCVFCGNPIAEGEPAAGRPPAAAHVACADSALADDRHWDAIAASSGEPMDDDASSEPTARRAGCLAGVIVVAAMLALMRRDQSRG